MNSGYRTMYGATVCMSVAIILSVHALGRAESTIQERTMEVEAKSLVVVELRFPGWGDVTYTSMTFSEDGERFRGIQRGLGCGEQLFTSSAYDDTSTILFVPIMPDMELGFLFPEPTQCYLRWTVGFSEAPGVKILQTVTVLPARDADLRFIDRLADSDFQRHLFGNDYFEKRYPDPRELAWALSADRKDHRALAIIAKLLEATRVKWVGDLFRGPKSASAEEEKRLRQWGDALFQLAKDLPESSYAPYAAYYSGCCFSAISMNRAIETVRAARLPDKRKDRLAEFKHRSEEHTSELQSH